MKNPRGLLGVDRYAHGQRRGVDGECFGNCQLREEQDGLAGERRRKFDRIRAAAGDRAVDAGVDVGRLYGFAQRYPAIGKEVVGQRRDRDHGQHPTIFERLEQQATGHALVS